MTPWESLLQSNNGLSIIKQLALIAFFFLEYIYISIRKTIQKLQKTYFAPSMYIFFKKTKKTFFFIFLASWKMAKFFLQSIFIFKMITDTYLVEKWITSEIDEW